MRAEPCPPCIPRSLQSSVHSEPLTNTWMTINDTKVDWSNPSPSNSIWTFLFFNHSLFLLRFVYLGLYLISFRSLLQYLFHKKALTPISYSLHLTLNSSLVSRTQLPLTGPPIAAYVRVAYTLNSLSLGLLHTLEFIFPCYLPSATDLLALWQDCCISLDPMLGLPYWTFSLCVSPHLTSLAGLEPAKAALTCFL